MCPTAISRQPATLFGWTAETITTVGYGDLYPVTDGGRIIGTILMVTGAISSVLTAYIASWFAGENRPKESVKEMMQGGRG